MKTAQALFWPVLMALSITVGLVLAFVAAGGWDVLALLMASWPLVIVAVRLAEKYLPKQ